jgi:hypothetical protein
MKTPTTKTRCETVDMTVPWTDDNGNLNVGKGDLVTDADKFEIVTEIHWNPAWDMRVAVGYEGRGSLVFKDPAETVKVHRYIEHTEE